jgi:hypothetical protein
MLQKIYVENLIRYNFRADRKFLARIPVVTSDATLLAGLKTFLASFCKWRGSPVPACDGQYK